MSTWKKLSSKYVHENKFYKVREDQIVRPDGQPGTYHVIESGQSAFVIAITDDERIIFEHMFRYPTQMESWELPAGGVEAGEDPLLAAQRELLEETGYSATGWEHIGTLQASNSKMDGMAHVFVCRGLQRAGEGSDQSEGIDTVTTFSVKEILTMTADGEITDSSSMGPLLLALAQDKLPGYSPNLLQK